MDLFVHNDIIQQPSKQQTLLKKQLEYKLEEKKKILIDVEKGIKDISYHIKKQSSKSTRRALRGGFDSFEGLVRARKMDRTAMLHLDRLNSLMKKEEKLKREIKFLEEQIKSIK